MKLARIALLLPLLLAGSSISTQEAHATTAITAPLRSSVVVARTAADVDGLQKVATNPACASGSTIASVTAGPRPEYHAATVTGIMNSTGNSGLGPVR